MDRLPMARGRAAAYNGAIEIQSPSFSPPAGHHS
jgi:hypothetical protein